MGQTMNHPMRRADREITGIQNLVAVLKRCQVLRVAFSVENQPYLVPLHFAWALEDGQLSLFFHSAKTGRKNAMMAKNNRVCFEADCAYELIKADVPCNWSARFESVIGEGIITQLTSEQEKAAALDLLMHRYGFEGKPDYGTRGVSSVAVFKIDVQHVTGKQKG